jgi:MFS family permease
VTTPRETLGVALPNPGPSFRSALKVRDFRLLFLGQLGSEVGNGLVQLALPLLVLEITGSAFQLGLTFFIQFLPMLLFGIIGGVLVDRWDRRLTIVVVEFLRGVAFLSVAIIFGADALWGDTFLPEPILAHLYVVIFIESTLANFFNPARVALLPNLVKPEDIRPANSLIEVSRHIGFLIAPPLGAFISGASHPSVLMLFDAVTFLLSAVLVSMIEWRPAERVRVYAESVGHNVSLAVSQTRAGLLTIIHSRMLQVVILIGFSLNVIVAPIQVLLPLYVIEVKGVESPEYAFGFLVAGLVIGLMGGSLGAPLLSRRLGLGAAVITCVLSLGAAISLGVWPPGLIAPFIAMLIAGLSIGFLNVAQATMLQTSSSDEERGRVSATYYTATLGARPLAFLAIGAVAGAVDIRILFLMIGMLTLTLGAGLSRIPEVRQTR